jgi:hypothetical protein
VALDDKTGSIIDHYNRTFEVTWKLWEQRNRTFLVLLLTIGIANLFTNDDFLLATMKTVFEHLNMKLGDLGKNGFPYQTFHSIMLTVVFYLMVNLYHRSASVLRSYTYIGLLEHEIRDGLGLKKPNEVELLKKEGEVPKEEVAFTRESSFYWNRRPLFFGVVKYFYILIVGAFLAFYYCVRVAHDRSVDDTVMLVIDAAVGVPTAIVFFAYAWEAVGRDRKPKPKASS